MNDMFSMMGKLGEVKDKMQEVKEKLPFMELEETSDDGLVTVKCTADKQINDISIDQTLISADNQNNLQYQVTETVNAAMEKADATYKAEMKKNLEGYMPNIPGLDLNNLPF